MSQILSAVKIVKVEISPPFFCAFFSYFPSIFLILTAPSRVDLDHLDHLDQLDQLDQLARGGPDGRDDRGRGNGYGPGESTACNGDLQGKNGPRNFTEKCDKI